MSTWHSIDLSRVDTPALIVDKDKVKHNIDAAISHAGGLERLRPHVKTHKSLEIAKMQVAVGIVKFKCATIPEAEMLGMAGAHDVLIAYQPQGPKVSRVLALNLTFPETKYSVLIDNEFSATFINKVFADANVICPVYIDVNNGHNRTGIKTANVASLVSNCIDLSNIKIIGLHCYDGHIRMASLDNRVSESTAAFLEVVTLKEQLEKEHSLSLNMVAGGSPSFSVHAVHHKVECSPGTFLFWDQRYGEMYEEQPFEKAAVVATRVISKIDAHTYCLDLGHKSIASEFPFPRLKFITDHDLKQTGHSEEHLTVTCEIPDALEVGQLLLGFPYHICPTVALYDHFQVVEAGAVIGQWQVTARDRKITI